MIIYVTKKTAERYGIGLRGHAPSYAKEIADAVIQRETGDALLEWGAKLFYFDRRKCLEVANFASKFTLFLIDIKVNDLVNIGNLMAHYMFDIYKDDSEMIGSLERYFKDNPFFIFSKLTDKGSIAHLNHTLSDFAWDGHRLADYIENNILQSMKFNKYFNTEWPVARTIDGKKEYVFPAETFAVLLKERYRGK